MRLIFFLFAFALSSCSRGVLLTFQNETGRDFQSLKVNIRGQEHYFQNLKTGGKPSSIRVPATYRYCYAQAVTATDTLICQPTDFVGETLYTKGKLKMTFFLPDQTSNYMGIKN
jgi:hypothetical protein